MTDGNGHASEVIAVERSRWAAPFVPYWERWRGPLVWAAVVYSVATAVSRFRFALPHLLRDVEEWSAVDFKYRYDEVLRWFSGLPVYGALDRLTYPPASYAILWPAMGWLPLDAARALWAATIIAAAAIIAWVAWRVTEGHPSAVRLLAAALPFVAYPVHVTVYVGQLPMHAVALAAIGTLLLVRSQPAWKTDGAAAVLLAASLVKPTLSPPLVAAAFIGTRRWRPLLLSAAVYVVLTVIAAAAQPTDVVRLVSEWLASSSNPSLVGGIAEGVPSLHVLLSRSGLGRWAPVASMIVLATFGVWAWRHRVTNIWTLVGVAAVVARLWSYHREYDDAVLLLAAIALLRVAAEGDRAIRWRAAVLFAVTWAALLTPTWALFSPNVTVVHAIYALHTGVWLAVLVFLVVGARHDLRHRRYAA